MSAQALANGVKPAYEQRVQLAKTVIKQNSTLPDEEARNLAIQVLRAIDHIPEKIR